MAKKPMYIYKVYYTINTDSIYDLLGISADDRFRYTYLGDRLADTEIAAHSIKEAADFADRHLIRKKGKKQGKIIRIYQAREVNFSRYYW